MSEFTLPPTGWKTCVVESLNILIITILKLVDTSVLNVDTRERIQIMQ